MQKPGSDMVDAAPRFRMQGVPRDARSPANADPGVTKAGPAPVALMTPRRPKSFQIQLRPEFAHRRF